MKPVIQSPQDPAFVQDPYPFYARMQAGDPVRFWQDYDMPAVFDPALINALLRDRRLGRVPPGGPVSAPAHMQDFYRIEHHSMLEQEPPTHTRLRGLVLRAFTSRRIAALAPDIDQICDSLLTALPHDTVDLLPAYCAQVPVQIIARLLGVPEGMSSQLLQWSNQMVAVYQAGCDFETQCRANAAARDFSAFLSGYIDQRRHSPADDLISHLIAAQTDGQSLSPDEMIATCILLLNAGHEATVHTLGNGVHALLRHGWHPDWLASGQIDTTIEEILRFDPPLHIFTRYLYEDMTVGRHPLAAGQQIALVLGAAGVEQPHRFDPMRPRPGHAAFGGGLHFCVGAPLARLELRIALQRLFAHFPEMALTQAPRYADIYHFHGLTALHVAPHGRAAHGPPWHP